MHNAAGDDDAALTTDIASECFSYSKKSVNTNLY